MFSDKLERTLKRYPAWADRLARIGAQLLALPPGDEIDPLILARRSQVPLGEVIALLGVLSDESAGRLRLRVVDEKGLEVATFARESDIPPVVEDAFGRSIEVDPENVDLVFKLSEP